MSLAKETRNQKLFKDYKSGQFSIVELVSKYRISSSAIYSIISRLEKEAKK